MQRCIFLKFSNCNNILPKSSLILLLRSKVFVSHSKFNKFEDLIFLSVLPGVRVEGKKRVVEFVVCPNKLKAFCNSSEHLAIFLSATSGNFFCHIAVGVLCIFLSSFSVSTSLEKIN